MTEGARLARGDAEGGAPTTSKYPNAAATSPRLNTALLRFQAPRKRSTPAIDPPAMSCYVGRGEEVEGRRRPAHGWLASGKDTPRCESIKALEEVDPRSGLRSRGLAPQRAAARWQRSSLAPVLSERYP